MGNVLAVLQPSYAFHVGIVEFLALQLRIIHLQQLLQKVFVDARLCSALALGRVAPQVVGTCDGADEVAVTHVGDSTEVGFVATGGGDATACTHPLAALFGVGLIRVVWSGSGCERVLIGK